MIDLLVAGGIYLGEGSAPIVESAVCQVVKSSLHAVVSLDVTVPCSSDKIDSVTSEWMSSVASSLEQVERVGFTMFALPNSKLHGAEVMGPSYILAQAERRMLVPVGTTTDPSRGRSAPRVRLPIKDGALTVLNYSQDGLSIREGIAWDVLDAHADVQQAKKVGDRVLVLLHGGDESYPLPRPRMRKELRFLADNGADIIIVPNTRVLAGYEIWNDVPICYGLGNFQVTKPSSRCDWYEGLLATVAFPVEKPARLTLIPIQQSSSFDTSLAAHRERVAILQQLEGYRIVVGSDAALDAYWREYEDSSECYNTRWPAAVDGSSELPIHLRDSWLFRRLSAARSAIQSGGLLG